MENPILGYGVVNGGVGIASGEHYEVIVAVLLGGLGWSIQTC